MSATYEPIATQTLSSNTSSIDFTSIPNTYTDLVLVMRLGFAGSYNNGFRMRFNSDSGANYSMTELAGTGSTTRGYRLTNQTSAWVSFDYGVGQYVYSGAFTVNIENYKNSSTYKTAITRGGNIATAAFINANLWRSTSAITSITVLGDTGATLLSGSIFTLYGIKAE